MSEGYTREWSKHKLYLYADTEYVVNQQQMLSLLDGLGNVRILDIGCGNGGFSLELMEKVSPCQLYGIDVDKSAIKFAFKRAVDVIIADTQHLPFKGENFDIVISNQVIEHVLNVDQFIINVQRVLKKNGMFILSTPNLCALHNRFLIMLGQQPTCLQVSEIQVGNLLRGIKTHGHVHSFSPAALNDLLKYHNFSIEKITGSGMYPLPHFLQKFFSKIFPSLAVFLIYKARKRG